MNEAGDFLGGVTGPLLNFLTFIAVLYTASMQAAELKNSNETLEATQEELKLSREISQKQFSHIEEESRKNEISKVLDLLDKEIQHELSKSVFVGKIFDDIIEDLEDFIKYMKSNSDMDDYRRFEMILNRIKFALVHMNNCIKEYNSISENTSVSDYYCLKYVLVAQRMIDTGMAKKDDFDEINSE